MHKENVPCILHITDLLIGEGVTLVFWHWEIWERCYIWGFCKWAIEEVWSSNILASLHMFTNTCIRFLFCCKEGYMNRRFYATLN